MAAQQRKFWLQRVVSPDYVFTSLAAERFLPALRAARRPVTPASSADMVVTRSANSYTVRRPGPQGAGTHGPDGNLRIDGTLIVPAQQFLIIYAALNALTGGPPCLSRSPGTFDPHYCLQRQPASMAICLAASSGTWLPSHPLGRSNWLFLLSYAPNSGSRRPKVHAEHCRSWLPHFRQVAVRPSTFVL